MLTKRRCMATGVINFYEQNEPHIAVGSVVRLTRSGRFIWHYHDEITSTCGTAKDLRAVEIALNEHHVLACRHGHDRQAAA